MIYLTNPRNSIKRADNLIRRLNGLSPRDLSICAQRDAIKEFYPKVNGRPNKIPVDELEEKQATAILLDLYENSQRLIKKDSRQATYETLRKLEQAFREKNKDEIERLEERLCIQLENPDTYDYEIEHEYFAFQTIKEDNFLPF